MTSRRFLSFLVSASVFCFRVVPIQARQNLCLLCEDGLNSLYYPNAVIKSDGTTCTSMALKMSVSLEEGSDECYQHMEAWRQICCGDDEPIDVEITEVFDQYPDIDAIETIGPYDKCDLCRDGDYPSSESMVIHFLYIGAGTCPQYWKAGQQGLIPNHLCDPVQFFSYEPCGCGEYSTNGNYHWGDPYTGDTPSDDDDTETPWWAGADGGDASLNDDEGGGKPWWEVANGGSKPVDKPWWAEADSYSGATVISCTWSRTWFFAIVTFLMFV